MNCYSNKNVRARIKLPQSKCLMSMSSIFIMLCGRILQHCHLGNSKSGWACIKFYKVWSVIPKVDELALNAIVFASNSKKWMSKNKITSIVFAHSMGNHVFLSFLGPLKLEIAPKHYIEWLDWQMSSSQVENITCNINLYFFNEKSIGCNYK